MIRYWVSVFILVFCVAAVQIFLVLSLLPDAMAGFAEVSALFALFFALTGAVAYFCVSQLKTFTEGERKKRLVPGAGEPVAKESVIAQFAPDWGLSQAEADVAIFVAKGFSNSEVADMRGCAIATVKSQLGSIYQKSGLGSRYQLMAFVTDEVCSAMTKENDGAHETRRVSVPTRKILPLTGRTKFGAPTNLEA